MFWLMLCILSSVNASDREEAVSHRVRMGATVFSRFLEQAPSGSLYSFLIRLADRVKQVDQRHSEGRGNEFILMLLKLAGIDSKKLTDLAFGGIISLALLMSQTLMKSGVRGRNVKEASKDFSWFQFVLSQPQVGGLLKQTQDRNLAELILKESEKKLKNYPRRKTDCIQLLLCGMKPVVRGMQRSLDFFINREKKKFTGAKVREKDSHEETCPEGDEGASWEKADLEDRMFFFLPSLREISDAAEECERLFTHCVY